MSSNFTLWGEVTRAFRNALELSLNLVMIYGLLEILRFKTCGSIFLLMKQTSFFKKESLSFGGVLSLNKRKIRRILCSKRPIHLVLKSNKFTLFKNRDWIIDLLRKKAFSKGIKIYKLSVQEDHIHLSIRMTSRELYKAFIRAVTGLIARTLGKGIWKLLPFTRIGHWGREFKAVSQYIFQNEMEVFGIWEYRERKYKLQV